MKKYWPFFIFTVIILLFLNRGLTNKAVFFGADEINSDLANIYAQHEYLSTTYYKKGQLPLWSSFVGSGIPADLQLASYSPMVILYILLPSVLAFNLIIIFNFLLIGWGILLYGQKIGLGKIPSLLSAIVFTLSGFMVGHLRHIFLESALVSLPYLLIVVEKIIESKKFIWGIVMAFLIYLSLSYGHPPTTFCVLLFIAIYFLFRLSSHFREENKEDLKPIAIFLAGVIFGLLLSAVMILPMFEQIRYSTRASFGIENSLEPPFKLKFLWLFFQPYAFGDPSRGTWDIYTDSFWENIGYLGILPLILAFVGLFWAKKEDREWRKIFALLSFFGLLLLLGILTPFYQLVWNWIPGFSFTRAPGRFLLFLDFGLAILAGFGLKALLEKFEVRKKIFLTILIVIITIIDLFIFGYHFNNVILTTYFEETATVKFLRQDSDLYRIRALNISGAWDKAWGKAKGWAGDLSPYFIERELIPEDNNIAYRLSSPAALYGLSGRFIIRRPCELDTAVLSQSPPDRTTLLLGMENVKYLLSFDPIEKFRNLRLVQKISFDKEQTMYIYQNQEWLPRAYLVGEAVYIPEANAVLDAMLNSSFNPAKEVIIEQKVAQSVRKGGGEVKIVSYSDNRVEMEVKATGDGFLVLSDTYYPGWKAYVDGKEQKILLANYNYRALEIQAGEHRVVFSYQPFSIKLGRIISGATLGGILLFLILRLFGFVREYYCKPLKKDLE
jgi:hypothetical protein